MIERNIRQKDDALRSPSRLSDLEPIVLLDFADSATVPPSSSFYLKGMELSTYLGSEGKLRNALLHRLFEATAKTNAVCFVVPFTRRETVAFAAFEGESFKRYWGTATSKYEPEESIYILDAYQEAQGYQCQRHGLAYDPTIAKFGGGFLSAFGLQRPIAIPLPCAAEHGRADVAIFASQDSESPDIRDFVSSLQNYRDQRRKLVREIIAREILSSRFPRQSLDDALDTIFTFPVSERLDEAIDLLVATGELAEQSALDTLTHFDVTLRTDEYWYSLVRSLGKLGKAAVVSQFAKSSNRSIREAVVEALGEMGDETSIALLRQFATNDDSEFIRRLARDTLAEHSE